MNSSPTPEPTATPAPTPATVERARLAKLRYDNEVAAFLEVLAAQRDLLVAEQQVGAPPAPQPSVPVHPVTAPAPATPVPAAHPSPALPTAPAAPPGAVATPEASPAPAPVKASSAPSTPPPGAAPPTVATPAKTSPQKNGPVPANEAKSPAKRFPPKRAIIVAAIVVVAAAAGFYAWIKLRDTGPGDGFASGNGRIEATEIDVATKLAGRVDDILVNEGDFVQAGQLLAKMQISVLEAQRDEARAQHQQAINTVVAAEAQVVVRESDKVAAEALVMQRKSELDGTRRRLARSETLSGEGASSVQELDDDRARERSAQAAANAAAAQVNAAQAAIDAAKAQVVGARSAVTAAEASIARVEADIQDSQLKSPRDGRVQYRVAQPGEVLAGGGKVLNLVDLGDVYLTFFLPETAVGKVALGSEVHLILDAAPQYVIPGKVSYVASVAQFTPKTVETASERQKLMFRVKAQIDSALLKKHLTLVKTGLPGMAWLKLDPQAQWPANLALKVSE